MFAGTAVAGGSPLSALRQVVPTPALSLSCQQAELAGADKIPRGGSFVDLRVFQIERSQRGIIVRVPAASPDRNEHVVVVLGVVPEPLLDVPMSFV